MDTLPHSRPRVDDDDIAAVAAALRSGHLAQGYEVRRLEAMLSAYFEGAHVVMVSSGTAALGLALRAVLPPDAPRVIVPSYTCASLHAAVAFAGGTTVCADSGPDSVNLTPEAVRAVWSDEVGAIIAPHMFGFEAPVRALSTFGVPVIEDCAQALGGRSERQTPLGLGGTTGVLSLYATKLLPVGEGGACITRDEELAGRFRAWRNADEQAPDARAFNFKMTDLCAALACSRWPKLSGELTRRNEIADRYDAAFGERSFRVRHGQRQAVCFRYLLEVDDIQGFLNKSRELGILCRQPVWQPLHRSLGGICPWAEHWERQVVSVPLYPNMTTDEIETVCRTLTQVS